MILTIAVFIAIIGVLVFVHELGHFLAAKRAGAKVEEFGFGFPPRILGIKKGETVYSLNLIPLGGFVKIMGEDGQDRSNSLSFSSKTIGQRAVILAAGVSMNFLLAIILIVSGLVAGLPATVSDEEIVKNPKIQIAQISPGSPAEAAGLAIGDTIIKVSGPEDQISDISKVGQVQDFAQKYAGQEILMTIKSGDKTREVLLTPRQNPPPEEGRMGVVLARTAIVSYPWYEAIYKGVIYTLNLIWIILAALGSILWGIFSNGQVASDVTGPVGIFSITGQAAHMGVVYIIQLAALLSINLGIINILPFPALDGGRLFFLLIEKFRGKPVSQRVEQIVHAAGFIFLILLMILITLRDVMKLF